MKAIKEKKNYPKEIPKPISLTEVTEYYNIIWRGGVCINFGKKPIMFRDNS